MSLEVRLAIQSCNILKHAVTDWALEDCRRLILQMASKRRLPNADETPTAAKTPGLRRAIREAGADHTPEKRGKDARPLGERANICELGNVQKQNGKDERASREMAVTGARLFFSPTERRRERRGGGGERGRREPHRPDRLLCFFFLLTSAPLI